MATGRHANKTASRTARITSIPASPTTADARLRGTGPGPTGPASPAVRGAAVATAASSRDPAQYGWNWGPRRPPTQRSRNEPVNNTASRKRPAPGRPGSYPTATHGAEPSGCAATTRGSPSGRRASAGAHTDNGTPGTPCDGIAARTAALNLSRAAASSAAPLVSTARLTDRPPSSTARYTTPAADSSNRAVNRNGPTWVGSPSGSGLDMAPT